MAEVKAIRRHRVLLSAGDPSGDWILSSVLSELVANAPAFGMDLEFVGLCGPRSSSAVKVKEIVSVKDVAVVGIVEVLASLGKIFKALARMRVELTSVDSLLCVDFPDFNFRLGKMAKSCGVPVDYIVAPQVWAWRSGRVADMRSFVRQLYPALGFEEELFRSHGVPARYLGHPIRDVLPKRKRRQAREDLGLAADDFSLAVLPGSRRSEIKRHLPLMIQAWDDLLRFKKNRLPGPDRIRVVVAMAADWDRESMSVLLNSKYRQRFNELLGTGEWCLAKEAHSVMMASDFAWITSGTASLEAAFYLLPHVLVYQLSGLSVFMLKRISSYFADPDAKAALPNILLERFVVPELLQEDLSPRRLALESLELLSDNTRMEKMRRDLRWIPKKMGEAGATKRIALDLLGRWSSESS